MSAEITIELLAKVFESSIDRVKKDNDRISAWFLAAKVFPIEQGETPTKLHAEFIFILAKIYQDVCLFPDQKVIQKFKDFGYKESHLCWFVSIGAIAEEIKRIHQAGILMVLEPSFFIDVIQYVQSMAWYTFIHESGYDTRYKGRGKTSFENFMVKYKRNKNHNEIDTDLYEYNNLRRPDSNETIYDLVKDVAKGKLEKRCFGALFKQGVKRVNADLPEDQFLLELYPLFHLIIRDGSLPENENDYYNRALKFKYDNFKRFKIGFLTSLMYKVLGRQKAAVNPKRKGQQNSE